MDDFSVQQAWIVHDRYEPLPPADCPSIAMRCSQAVRTCLAGASAMRLMVAYRVPSGSDLTP